MSKNLNNSGAEVESNATRIRKQHNGNQEATRQESGSSTMEIRKRHDGNQKAARWESESSTLEIRKQHDGNQEATRQESGSGTIGIGCGNWLRKAEIEDCGAGKRRNLEEIFGES